MLPTFDGSAAFAAAAQELAGRAGRDASLRESLNESGVIANALACCRAAIARLTSGGIEFDDFSGSLEHDSARLRVAPELDVLRGLTAVVRLCRNACIHCPENQCSLASAGLVAVLLAIVKWECSSTDGSGGGGAGGSAWSDACSSLLLSTWQCFANLIADNDEVKTLVWTILMNPMLQNYNHFNNNSSAASAHSIIVSALDCHRNNGKMVDCIIGFLYSLQVARSSSSGTVDDADDAGVTTVVRGRLAALTADAHLFPRILAVSSKSDAAAPERMGDASASSASEWAVLLVERILDSGLLATAYSTACTGTPFSLIFDNAATGSDGAPSPYGAPQTPVLTLECLRLLALVEVALEQHTPCRVREDCGVCNTTSASSSTSDVATGGISLMRSSDVLFLVKQLDQYCAFLCHSRRGGSDAATAGGKPLVYVSAACMLCDVLADVLLAAASQPISAMRALGALHVSSSSAEVSGGSSSGFASTLFASTMSMVEQQSALGSAEVEAALVAVAVPVVGLLHAASPAGAPPPPAATAADAAQATTIAAPSSQVGDGVGHGTTIAPPSQEEKGGMTTTSHRLPPSSVPDGARVSLTRLAAVLAAPDIPSLGARVATQLSRSPWTVFTVLNQCSIDKRNPMLREWGLVATRNLCASGPDVIPVLIESLKAERVAAVPELAALGVRASLRPDGSVSVTKAGQ